MELKANKTMTISFETIEKERGRYTFVLLPSIIIDKGTDHTLAIGWLRWSLVFNW